MRALTGVWNGLMNFVQDWRAVLLLSVAVSVTTILSVSACSSVGSTTTAPTTAVAVPAAASADQTLVTELNTVKAKYPADTTPKVTLISLPTFVKVACSVVSGGLGSSPEWQEIATTLAKTKRCTP